MRELVGDLWDFVRWRKEGNNQPPWLVVPTNGKVNSRNEAVMGAGVAKEAARRFPHIPRELGRLLMDHGNVVQRFTDLNYFEPFDLITFPTKGNWDDKSDLDLMRRSCRLLRPMAQAAHGLVVMPRVGAGLGRLPWSEVRAMLEAELPEDKFVVVSQ